jgi:TMEM175 potassium channel family protein
LNTNRLETFADGVFAIAATLLILNVDAQVSEDVPDLGGRLLDIWPSYAAYAVTFFTIGIVWVNHHTVMSQIDRADRVFLFLNVGFLMLVAFAPFPTRLIAEHIRGEGARAATLTYGITWVLVAVMFNALWLYASVGTRLLRADHDPKVVRGITRSYALGPVTYLVATLVSIISPTVGVILFAAIVALYILDSSTFGRAKQRE